MALIEHAQWVEDAKGAADRKLVINQTTHAVEVWTADGATLLATIGGSGAYTNDDIHTGDGTTTSFTYTHNLGSVRPSSKFFQEVAPAGSGVWQEVLDGVAFTHAVDGNSTTVDTGTAPAAGVALAVRIEA